MLDPDPDSIKIRIRNTARYSVSFLQKSTVNHRLGPKGGTAGITYKLTEQVNFKKKSLPHQSGMANVPKFANPNKHVSNFFPSRRRDKG
jgi:hypothetical protein